MNPDHLRPQYHFMPPANWMNDPNGLIHWQGRYHMFYQYNPHGAQWGDIHWGHADSADLVHWTHRPIALAPEPGGPDAGGCWSGCAVDCGEEAAFLYTGVVNEEKGGWRQRPCLAWADGNLETLRRDAANPVIAEPPEGMRPVGFRDHSLWKEADGWRMVIGSGERGRGGSTLLYASPDLRKWKYLGRWCEARDIPPTEISLGDMWECPGVFFDRGWTGLFISSCDGGYGPTVFTGRTSGSRFLPQRVEKLDHGGTAFYAPQAFVDRQGRTLMFGWLTEARSAEAQARAGWSGVMSLPRRIWIDEEGRPGYAFAAELESLRQGGLHLSDEVLKDGLRGLGVKSAQVEVRMELKRGSAPRGGLSLLRSPDGTEETRLAVDWEQSLVTLERGKASLEQPGLADVGTPFEAGKNELSLAVYLDGSTIECIIDERASLTGRIYPTRTDSLEVGLFAEGGEILVPHFDLYSLASAW